MTSQIYDRFMNMPLLTREEERDLFIGWRVLGRMKDRDELIVRHLRMVIPLARRYSQVFNRFEDFFQAGAEGLLDAAERFDIKQEHRFSTYAIYRIRHHLQTYLRKNYAVGPGSTIRLKPDDELTEDIPSEGMSPEQAAIDAELRAKVKAAIRTVSEDVGSVERRVMGARYSNGDMKSIRTISEETGLSRRKVGRHVQILDERIREALEPIKEGM